MIQVGDIVKLSDGSVVSVTFVDPDGSVWYGGEFTEPTNCQQIKVFDFLADLKPLTESERTISDIIRFVKQRTGVSLTIKNE